MSHVAKAWSFWLTSINNILQLTEQIYQVAISTLNNGHVHYPKKIRSRKVSMYLKNKGIVLKVWNSKIPETSHILSSKKQPPVPTPLICMEHNIQVKWGLVNWLMTVTLVSAETSYWLQIIWKDRKR